MIGMSKVWLCSLFFLLFSISTITCAEPAVEASTVITGSIVVGPDGSVRSYTLDHPEELANGITQLVAKSVPQWKFYPYLVDGKPVVAKAAMSIRLVAHKLDNGQYGASVKGAVFSSYSKDQWSDFKVKRVVPKYPPRAIRSRVSGTVYVVAEVDHQGNVENVAAEQVNLRALGAEAIMRRARNMLADAAVSAIGQWKFDTSKLPFPAGERYSTVRIPVAFNLRVDRRTSPGERYGQWQSYVPGPLNIIPWLDQRQMAAGSPDALPAGGIHPLDPHGLKLQTTLGGS